MVKNSKLLIQRCPYADCKVGDKPMKLLLLNVHLEWNHNRLRKLVEKDTRKGMDEVFQILYDYEGYKKKKSLENLQQGIEVQPIPVPSPGSPSEFEEPGPKIIKEVPGISGEVPRMMGGLMDGLFGLNMQALQASMQALQGMFKDAGMGNMFGLSKFVGMDPNKMKCKYLNISTYA